MSSPHDVATAVTDVSDAASVDDLARATVERFGAAHVVCNNAGVAGGGPVWQAYRNWPAASGPPPDGQDMPGSEEIRQAVTSAVESGLDPAVIATAVRDAIVGDKFWILTHPDPNAAILRRYTGAVDGANPSTPILT